MPGHRPAARAGTGATAGPKQDPPGSGVSLPRPPLWERACSRWHQRNLTGESQRLHREQARSHKINVPVLKCSKFFLSPPFDEFFQSKGAGCARLNPLIFSKMNINVHIQICVKNARPLHAPDHLACHSPR
ncbi:hypothetical protein EU514_17630 [Pseudomonas fragi]|nr:hypothetical protein [Pseudomonas fragi]